MEIESTKLEFLVWSHQCSAFFLVNWTHFLFMEIEFTRLEFLVWSHQCSCSLSSHVDNLNGNRVYWTRFSWMVHSPPWAACGSQLGLVFLLTRVTQSLQLSHPLFSSQTLSSLTHNFPKLSHNTHLNNTNLRGSSIFGDKG